MDSILLDDIPAEIDFDRLLKRIRVDAASSQADEIRRLAAQARGIARPKALSGVAYIDSMAGDDVVIDGVTFTSRVLRVNLEDAHRVFPFIATCGVELEEWAGTLDGMLERFWADAIREAVLGTALNALSDHVEKEIRPGPTSVMSPGSLEDWPIQQQTQLFELLGDPRRDIGVRLTDSFLMVPIKSISGIRYPTETSFQSCQLCPREKCIGRRAPYEPELWQKRYQPAGQ